MRTSPPARRVPRPAFSDRWAFKPVALLLLVPVIAAAAGLTAVVISPPFLGLGYGIEKIDKRLQEEGASFTRIPPIPQRSTIYANDGKTVLARVYLDNREIVPLNEVAPIARQAVLAIEDSEFYRHGALNLNSLVRAIAANLRSGEVVQGGSTITQQLVKNTLGLDPNDRTFARKFQEAALAMRVEQTYTKDKILSMYLNEVYLGNNVYGIGTASQFYFHEAPSKLTLPQAALIAGLIRAPAYYDPLERPHKAWLRRNDVLNRMIALGPANGGISAEAGDAAKATPLGLARNVGQIQLPNPPFMVDYVKEQILDDPNGWYSVLGATRDERSRALSEGGLSIITTLNPNWQKAAQKAADLPWAEAPAHPEHKPPADLAIVSIETTTGAIETMLSGKHYNKDQVNTVTTLHQPGSSFKPYLLAAAFEEGISPYASYSGVQGAINDPRCETNGQPWVVINAEGSSTGPMNLYTATADSVNAVFAHLMLDVGPEHVVDVAHRMGITSTLPAVCSLATGSVGISPLDQASGYQTLANGGVHCVPYAVAEIRKGDQILYRQRPDCTQVIAPSIANLVTDLLKGPVTYGTAASVFASGWGPWPIRGKTGTADSNTNVWFAGYTREVTTAVWVGSQGTPYPLSEYWGYDVFGGSIAAPIWKAYMLQVMQGLPPLDFASAQLISVPYVVGKSLDDARQILKSAGFQIDTQVIGSYLPAGTVVEQSPSAGAQAVQGSVVTLSLSDGVASKVSLPDVVGLSLSDAQSQLGAIHVVANVVPQTVTNASKVGVVLSMDPAAGTVVDEGSSVQLVVGASASPSPSPTGSPSPRGH
ncbi:MAG TPA: transglycosylase domain-containing protein [Actinomycetota bacterium]|nr:transglycosylase domain-containing protein [Actinomycetota bacterium]